MAALPSIPSLPDWLPGLAAVVLAVLGTLKVSAWVRQWRGWRAQRRGKDGERRAEPLLKQQGFRIIERQPRRTYALQVDGREQPVTITPDLLVAEGDTLWVVEVKTGDRGARVGFAGTRRQLLEYQLAFDVSGVLLVDPNRGRVQRVHFPFGAPAAGPRPGRAGPWVLAAGLAALIAASWLLRG